jgi:hypothetical protein
MPAIAKIIHKKGLAHTQSHQPHMAATPLKKDERKNKLTQAWLQGRGGEGKGVMGRKIRPGQTGLLILGVGEDGSALHKLHSQLHLRPQATRPSPWKPIVISRLWSQKALM